MAIKERESTVHGTPFDLKIVEKQVPFNEGDKKVMYHLATDKLQVIDFEKLAKSTIEKLGVNKYLAQAMTGMLSEAILEWMEAGHAVRISNIGTLRPTVKCKAHVDPADCSIDDLQLMKIRFYPSKSIMKPLKQAPLRINNRQEMIEKNKRRRSEEK